MHPLISRSAMGFAYFLALSYDASVDDAMRVDVGVMHDVELASDEVPHRHVSQLPCHPRRQLSGARSALMKLACGTYIHIAIPRK